MRRRLLLFSLFAFVVNCSDSAEPGANPVPSAGQSSATVPEGAPGRATSIQIQTRDENGQALSSGGLNVAVTVDGANAGAAVTVNDNGDGTYTASYTPDSTGVDTVTITLDGSAIGGSPFTSIVEIFGFGTAVIDGTIDPVEWAGASRVAVFSGDTELVGSFLYVMNDDSHLFLALSAVDPTLDDNDIMGVRFDNTLDSVDTVGDDGLDLRTSGFADQHFEPGAYAVGDAQQDGSGAITDAGTEVHFEMAHPLNSGDADDFSLESGARLGVCVRYFKDGTSSDVSSFGEGCVLAVNEQTRYVVFRIASP